MMLALRLMSIDARSDRDAMEVRRSYVDRVAIGGICQSTIISRVALLTLLFVCCFAGFLLCMHVVTIRVVPGSDGFSRHLCDPG